MRTSRRNFLAGVSAATALSTSRVAFGQKKYDMGATDTEIKIGHTNPYSGPASSYSSIGKLHQAYFRMVNETGGINGRKINFISYDDGYQPPKTVEMIRKLVEEDQVLACFNMTGTPCNSGHPQIHEPEEGAAALHRHRRLEVGQPQGFPVDHGLPARLSHRGHHLRQAHPGQRQGRQDRRALPE